MKTHQKADSFVLAKWKICEFFTFNEAMNLIFDYEPGTLTFSSYYEDTLPNEVLPVYRKLKDDINQFAITLYFNGNEIDCYESAAITLNLNLDAYQHSDWWINCKLFRNDIKKWLKLTILILISSQ